MYILARLATRPPTKKHPEGKFTEKRLFMYITQTLLGLSRKMKLESIPEEAIWGYQEDLTRLSEALAELYGRLKESGDERYSEFINRETPEGLREGPIEKIIKNVEKIKGKTEERILKIEEQITRRRKNKITGALRQEFKKVGENPPAIGAESLLPATQQPTKIIHPEIFAQSALRPAARNNGESEKVTKKVPGAIFCVISLLPNQAAGGVSLNLSRCSGDFSSLRPASIINAGAKQAYDTALPEKIRHNRKEGKYYLTQSSRKVLEFYIFWDVVRSINHQIDTEMRCLKRQGPRRKGIEKNT